MVGTCGYYRGFIGDVGEIGYVLGEGSRGQGLITESVRLAVDFGFDVMKLAKVVAFTNAENPSSIAVLRRCGFEELGQAGDGARQRLLQASEVKRYLHYLVEHVDRDEQ